MTASSREKECVLVPQFFFETLFSPGVLLVFLFGAVRLVGVFWTAGFLSQRFSLPPVAGLVTSWVFWFVAQVIGSLSLSLAGWLSGPTILSFEFVLMAAAFFLPRQKGFHRFLTPKGWWEIGLLAGLIGLVLVMTIRTILFTDLTWDALTYGLPRIALWSNAHSVLVHMPTNQVNLFSNEWNGELISLGYALVGGVFTGPGFGTWEVLIFFLATLIWLGRAAGMTRNRSLAIALLLGTAPAVLGLASTVKGDLLAVAGIMFALAWFLWLGRVRFTAFGFSMVILGVALGVGAKISSLLFGLALIGVVVVADAKSLGECLRRAKPMNILLVLLAGVLLMARYALNIVDYGQPIVRAPGEAASFSLGNLSNNMKLSLDRLTSIFEDETLRTTSWALSADMGSTFWYVLLLASLGVSAWIANRLASRGTAVPQPSPVDKPFWLHWRLGFAVLALVVADLATMAGIPTKPWVFRYFLPGTLALLALVAFAAFPRNLRELHSFLLLWFTLAIGSNLSSVAKPGEIFAMGELNTLLSHRRTEITPLEWVTLKIPFVYAAAGGGTVGLDRNEGQDILVYNNMDSPLVPLFGSRAQNRIQMVSSVALFARGLTQDKPDFAVYARRSAEEKTDLLIKEALALQNYHLVVENSLYLIAVPEGR